MHVINCDTVCILLPKISTGSSSASMEFLKAVCYVFFVQALWLAAAGSLNLKRTRKALSVWDGHFILDSLADGSMESVDLHSMYPCSGPLNSLPYICLI